MDDDPVPMNGAGNRKPPGNAKYQELIRQEKEWLKARGASLCPICRQIHPPMKYEGRRYDGPHKGPQAEYNTYGA